MAYVHSLSGKLVGAADIPLRYNAEFDTVAVTSTSGRIAIPTTKPGSQLRISIGVDQADVFMTFGDSTVVATTTTGMHLPSPLVEVVTIPRDVTHVAFITGASTATVYLMWSVGA